MNTIQIDARNIQCDRCGTVNPPISFSEAEGLGFTKVSELGENRLSITRSYYLCPVHVMEVSPFSIGVNDEPTNS